MTTILIDRIDSVVFHNGVLRVDCISVGPKGEERPAGTLLIPANQTGAVLDALVNATRELDRRLREQQAQQSNGGADTPHAGSAPADKKNLAN